MRRCACRDRSSSGAEQITSAEQRNLRRFAEQQQQSEKALAIPRTVSWDQNGKFKSKAEVKLDGDHLHLVYQVQDPSPWVNNGRDWTTLFATGDTVDLQLGVDASADPDRRKPVEGDQRLLIAPFEGETIAVLYQHRKPGGYLALARRNRRHLEYRTPSAYLR
jgi:hypothetical protein